MASVVIFGDGRVLKSKIRFRWCVDSCKIVFWLAESVPVCVSLIFLTISQPSKKCSIFHQIRYRGKLIFPFWSFSLTIPLSELEFTRICVLKPKNRDKENTLMLIVDSIILATNITTGCRMFFSIVLYHWFLKIFNTDYFMMPNTHICILKVALYNRWMHNQKSKNLISLCYKYLKLILFNANVPKKVLLSTSKFSLILLQN